MQCASEASTTAILRYRTREVLFVDLTADRDPHLVDLCVRHAAALTPPVGWHVEDERSAHPVGV
jgi:hypothetical protein